MKAEADRTEKTMREKCKKTLRPLPSTYIGTRSRDELRRIFAVDVHGAVREARNILVEVVDGLAVVARDRGGRDDRGVARHGARIFVFSAGMWRPCSVTRRLWQRCRRRWPAPASGSRAHAPAHTLPCTASSAARADADCSAAAPRLKQNRFW